MIALVPAVGGALLVAGVLSLVAGLRPTETPETVRVRSGTLTRLRSMPKRTRMLLLGGLAAGVVAWLVTEEERSGGDDSWRSGNFATS